MCVDGMFGVWIRAVCLCDVGVFAHVHSVTSRSVCVCVCVCAASARLSVYVDIYGLIMKVWREREERR